jgi:hypothetical protein
MFGEERFCFREYSAIKKRGRMKRAWAGCQIFYFEQEGKNYLLFASPFIERAKSTVLGDLPQKGNRRNLLKTWCRGWESNPHAPGGAQDFKSFFKTGKIENKFSYCGLSTVLLRFFSPQFPLFSHYTAMFRGKFTVSRFLGFAILLFSKLQKL